MLIKKIVLINPNKFKPPVPPLGLDYLTDSLIENGYIVDLFDLGVHDQRDLASFVTSKKPDIIGITVRNIDYCQMLSKEDFKSPIEELRDLIQSIRMISDAKIVLGGAGFSIMPREIMSFVKADFGVIGEGEFVFNELLLNLTEPYKVHNIIYSRDKYKDFIFTEKKEIPIDNLPSFKRRLLTLKEYKKYIGSVESRSVYNIQTKRGCNRNCTYCAEPEVIGKKIRRRSISKVIEELETLISYDIREKIFFTDSEFNVCNEHAYEVAKAIIDNKLDIRWSCYMTPDGVTKELLDVIKRSGCEMIAWSFESASDKILNNLGKSFTVSQMLNVADVCQKIGQNYAALLMFGAPGETIETVNETFKNISKIKPQVLPIVSGIRIYPHTKLYEIAQKEGILDSKTDMLFPVYYKEQYVKDKLLPVIMERFSTLKNSNVIFYK